MLHELEALIRGGKLGAARRKLRELKLKSVSRQQALTYASLARRLDLAGISLKILNPIVRAEKARRSYAAGPATAQEKIEYAAALRGLGAVPEARALLAEIDPRAYPQAWLHLAHCHVYEWRYDAAISLLRAYVESFRHPAYAMYIGKVNLLAALIHEERLPEAEELAEQLLEELRRPDCALLYRNTMELAARLEIVKGNWDRAISRLEGAERLVEEAPDSVYALLIIKWLAVARSLKARSVQPQLLDVRRRAIELRNWEIARDCDFYIAKVSGLGHLLVRLYFGTPFGSFRTRIREAMGPARDLPEVFLWRGDRPRGEGSVFDLRRGSLDGGSIRLAPGQELHRIFILLCRDFYQPVPLLSLFSRLFPEEQFNPETSPNRVHHIVMRFRKWILENGIPVRVEEFSGSYRLAFEGPFSVAVPREPLPLAQRELELLRLRLALGQNSFTAREAMAALDVSKATIQRLLKWALLQGRVEISGQTNHARYHWSPTRS